MANHTYKAIWISGTETSLESLVHRLLDSVNHEAANRDTAEDPAIVIYWQETGKFNLQRNSKGYVIGHVAANKPDPIAFNHALESFWFRVLEPIKDTTGGVASGISFE